MAQVLSNCLFVNRARTELALGSLFGDGLDRVGDLCSATVVYTHHQRCAIVVLGEFFSSL
ncbi:hypothetical protein A6F49_10780 [Enteractinococcus helveticum]|uniref:Uncharacterized protein n=1 Tax=Enteractinococcus helveticum TaxID=1837282 RepID=A0A1B7LZJ0_9MICC|nr:hypothetical protein A6F49_10780 [Enteractinococcus helveticum]